MEAVSMYGKMHMNPGTNLIDHVLGPLHLNALLPSWSELVVWLRGAIRTFRV